MSEYQLVHTANLLLVESPSSGLSCTSATFGDILMITSPKSEAGPWLAQSPTSPCSVPSPVTPYTPTTPPSSFRLTPMASAASGVAQPLLRAPSSCLQASPISRMRAGDDPYTHLAPQVPGSRFRRYATPTRQLRVTIPDSNTRPFQRSHRKLPSENVITCPPRVLARSINELVGDAEEPGIWVASPVTISTMQAIDKNVDEVARLGW